MNSRERGYQIKDFDSIDNPPAGAPEPGAETPSTESAQEVSPVTAETSETNAEQIVMVNPVLTRLAERGGETRNKLSSLWERGNAVAKNAGEKDTVNVWNDTRAEAKRGRMGETLKGFGETAKKMFGAGAEWLARANRTANEWNQGFTSWIGKKATEAGAGVVSAAQRVGEAAHSYSSEKAAQAREFIGNGRKAVGESVTSIGAAGMFALNGIMRYARERGRVKKLEKLRRQAAEEQATINEGERAKERYAVIKAKMDALQGLRGIGAAEQPRTANDSNGFEPLAQAA